ncbi:MAG: hypothetical protein JWR07_5137 [Nevskia sp.]|nr:hypothetical protein [Nevskia sp.]
MTNDQPYPEPAADVQPVIIFVDSNILQQFIGMDSFPWKRISDAKAISVLVPQNVVREIDKHKNQGNSRVAHKARAANSIFKKILEQPERKLVVRTSSPHVTVAIAPRGDPTFKPPGWDSPNLDDQILAEVLRFRHSNPQACVYFMTGDTIPRMTADDLDIACIVPPEDARLPPETDERDKKLNQLQRELEDLRKAAPKILVRIDTKLQDEIGELVLHSVNYPSLTKKQIHDLIARAKSRIPLERKEDILREPIRSKPAAFAALAALAALDKWVPPLESTVDDYLRKYPQWATELEKRLVSLHRRLTFMSSATSFTLELSNDGTVPAHDAMFELRAIGGFYLLPDDHEGARLEVAAAAMMLAADYELVFIGDKGESGLRPEFLATHRKSGVQLMVEVKSRHRPGVMAFQPNKPRVVPNSCNVEGLIRDALAKNPSEPLLIFIDLNIPALQEDTTAVRAELQGCWETLQKEERNDGFPAIGIFFCNDISPWYVDIDLPEGGNAWCYAMTSPNRHGINAMPMLTTFARAFQQRLTLPTDFPDGDGQ